MASQALQDMASCLLALPIRVAKEAVLTNKLIHKTKEHKKLVVNIFYWCLT